MSPSAGRRCRPPVLPAPAGRLLRRICLAWGPAAPPGPGPSWDRPAPRWLHGLVPQALWLGSRRVRAITTCPIQSRRCAPCSTPRWCAHSVPRSGARSGIRRVGAVGDVEAAASAREGRRGMRGMSTKVSGTGRLRGLLRDASPGPTPEAPAALKSGGEGRFEGGPL